MSALALLAERRPKSRKTQAAVAFTRAVEAFLGDLLMHYPRMVHVLTDNRHFSGKEVTARHFRAACEGMMRAGLVGRWEARRSKGRFYSPGGAEAFGPGWASRFWVEPELERMAVSAGVLPDPSSHFVQPEVRLTRRETVVLRRPSQGSGLKGARMRLPASPHLERLRDEIAEIQAAVDHADIQGCHRPSLYRAFTLDYGADDRLGLHGRWYAMGSESYMAMPKAARTSIELAGDRAAEVDVSASAVWCLYGAAERLGIVRATPLADTDLYAVHDLPRAIVKRFMAATWGLGRLPERWPRGSQQDMAEKGVDLGRYSVAGVRDAVLSVHPVLASLDRILVSAGLERFGLEDHRKVCSHWLMGIEAEAMTTALLRLHREDRITALPLHDGLIVPARLAETAVYRLQEAYREVAGVEPPVSVKGRAR